MWRSSLLVLGVVSSSLACGGPTSPSTTPLTGAWGGDHVSLTVTAAASHAEFDCAHGSIDNSILLDDQGRFEIKGVLVREPHGPIRVGHEPKNESAVYSGRLQGAKMTLWVTLSGSQETLGTYSLVHGEQGIVRKCR